MHLEKRLFYLRNNETQVGFHTGNGTTQEIVDLDKANKTTLLLIAIFVRSEIKIRMKPICGLKD